MKKSTPKLEIGIICASAAIIILSFFFLYKSAGQFSQTEILGAGDISKLEVPATYEKRISKGDKLMASKLYSMAASEYAFAINIQTESPEAYFKLGNAYLALRENEKAAIQFKKASDLDAENLVYKSEYGHALIRNKQFDDAQAAFDSFTKESGEAKYYAALLDVYFGRFEDSKTKLEKAKILNAKVETSNIDKLLGIFALFEKLQDGQEVYLNALLAEAFNEMEEYELAEGLSLKILGSKSDYRDVWILLGYAQLKTENFAEAEISFKQAKKLDAIKPETHYFLATALYFQKKYEEGVVEYELALLYGFKPELEVYNKIADSYLLLNKYDEALAAYEHIIKIDNTDVTLFVKPVWIAITYLNDLNRALSLAKDAEAKFPENSMSHNLLGWVYIEKDELDKAEKELNLALSLDPSSVEALYNQGRLQEKKGNLESAKSYYKKTYENADETNSIAGLAAEKYNSLILEDIK